MYKLVALIYIKTLKMFHPVRTNYIKKRIKKKLKAKHKMSLYLKWLDVKKCEKKNKK